MLAIFFLRIGLWYPNPEGLCTNVIIVFVSRFYFGFSSAVNLRYKKLDAVLKAIPRERILVESDRSTVHNEELQQMCSIIGDALSCTACEAAQLTYKNACEFFECFSTVDLQECV